MFDAQKKVLQTAITPLALYIPLKQDSTSQAGAMASIKNFNPGKILSPDLTLHFLRVTLVPNVGGNGYAGIMLATIFDGPMNPYLTFFWNQPDFQALWAAIISLASNFTGSPSSYNDFQNYVNDNNLNTQQQLSFAYTASAAQITHAFPPATTPQINPLSLYVPLKQDVISQATALGAQKIVGGNYIPADRLLHFSNVALIPNTPDDGKHAGLLLLTCFDGPMNPYLSFFWESATIRILWELICTIATNAPPVGDRDNLATFTNYINANDLTAVGDLSSPYTASVAQIANKFPFSTTIAASF